MCTHQCPGPRGEMQLSPASEGDAPGFTGGSGPGFYPITAFARGPGAHEDVWSFKSEASISPHHVGLLKSSRTFGLQSQLLCGLVLPVPELPAVYSTIMAALLSRANSGLFFCAHSPGSLT